MTAVSALFPKFLRALMNHDAADIGNPSEGVGEDKNGIALPNTVSKQQDRTHQAQPPEGKGDNDLFLFFRRNPLDEEAGEKNQVARPANYFPPMPLHSSNAVSLPE